MCSCDMLEEAISSMCVQKNKTKNANIISSTIDHIDYVTYMIYEHTVYLAFLWHLNPGYGSSYSAWDSTLVFSR